MTAITIIGGKTTYRTPPTMPFAILICFIFIKSFPLEKYKMKDVELLFEID